ncbi:MAG: dbpA [Daejeonella sp.]|nr:dbpA [Daejeonella sp.]
MIQTILDNLKIAALNEMQKVAVQAADNRDVIILSPTGSGKTLAFLLPILASLDKNSKEVQALIVVPSRELALQIEQVFRQMGTGFKVNCCYGGHSTKTERNNLIEPAAVLIGTPGRLAFHIRNEHLDTKDIKTLVLDEFDKALEFGFENDMAFIIGHLHALKKRILTSATQMAQIPAFTKVSKPIEIDFLKDQNNTPDLVLKAVLAEPETKLEILFSLICKIGNKATLVFCNHREAVERISDILREQGLAHGIFHGGMEQEDREKALLKFRNGSYRILITTDLASRGLDIPEIEYIVHYQLPHNEEAFVHRNGRTARMHAKGTSYLVLTEGEEPDFIKKDIDFEVLPEKNRLPEQTPWETLYIAAGKKDKVNKIDIVGLLLQKGALQKDELGLIEVQDFSSYAAVKRNKINGTLNLIKGEKLKNKKVRIEISR